MYKYSFGVGTNLSIKTPKVNSLDDIKKTINQTADCITNHSEYPNGLIIDMIEYADKIEIISNKPIIENEDGSLKFED